MGSIMIAVSALTSWPDDCLGNWVDSEGFDEMRADTIVDVKSNVASTAGREDEMTLLVDAAVVVLA
jgi:hypothetical protein